MIKIQVSSIDAIHDGEGWNENQSFSNDDDIFYISEDILYSPRKLFSFLRKHNYLTDYSKGRVELSVFPSIEYYSWICDRSNHMPIFAVSEIWD